MMHEMLQAGLTLPAVARRALNEGLGPAAGRGHVGRRPGPRNLAAGRDAGQGRRGEGQDRLQAKRAGDRTGLQSLEPQQPDEAAKKHWLLARSALPVWPRHASMASARLEALQHHTVPGAPTGPDEHGNRRGRSEAFSLAGRSRTREAAALQNAGPNVRVNPACGGGRCKPGTRRCYA